ncbi:glycosyltransferase [Microbacterium sp. NPDC058342]|uniref:glycosyltransferase n=1 Tax=Microbacterium sp. NPDC058342 TaxID=3346454 RepID=UPI00365B2C38
MARKSRVAVWRWGWLAPSETFIRSQFDAYARWAPVAIGAERVSSDNARPQDRVLFEGPRKHRLARFIFKLWDWNPRLIALIRETDPDIVHAHFGGDASRVRRAALKLGKRFVVTLHGADVTARPNRTGMRGRRNRRRLMRVLRDADLLVAVSNHIADAATKLGADPAKVVVLPIGVPWEPAPAEAPRSGVLFVGRFVEKKGIPDLIDAYSRLPDDVRRAHRLQLIGDGPLASQIREQVKRLRLDVDMPGFLSRAEVQRRLESSAVLAVPSHTASDGDTEGLPTVVFEAARSATPIVGYGHAGIPEAVQHGLTGLLAPERDVPRLTSYLEELLASDRRARQMGAAARARFEEEFTVTTRTKALENHYDGLMS